MTTNSVTKWRKVRFLQSAGFAAVALGVTISFPGAAFAQTSSAADSPAELANDAAAESDIVVTGSRVARSGFNAPTPTTIVGADTMQNRAVGNVAALLADIPAFRASSTPSTTTTGFREGAGGNFVNLRALGANRTLVLEDGHRIVPSTSIGTVDLNIIPSIMLERVEVVTGGASAAYGSDAVAGVVNLILNRKFNGLKAEAQAGVSSRGDGQTYRFAGTAGIEFSDSRGHLSIGGEFEDYKGVRGIAQRPWSNNPVGVILGSDGIQHVVDDFQVNNLAYGGIINAGPLKGIAFGPGGALYNFQYGTTFGNTSLQSGGGQPRSFNYDQADLSVPYTRYSGLARFDYEFSPAFKVFVIGNASHVDGVHPTVESRDANLTIRRDNAFLPAALAAQMDARSLTTITVGRLNNDLSVYQSDSRNNTWRIVGGFEGDFGGGWKWDASFGYGENKLHLEMQNDRIDGRLPGDPVGTRRWTSAIDAVVSGGQIVCRINADTSTTNDVPGCTPFNVFGPQTPTAAQKAFLLGSTVLDQTTSQLTAAANIQGSPFSTWAGPISIAAGVEYRKDSINAVSDPASQLLAFNIGNTVPLSGSINVTEGYLETVIPLLKDVPLFQSVELNGAVRRTHYSIAGNVTTWKGGLTWILNDDIRFRATRSRDIRAPNLLETFTVLVTGSSAINYNFGAGSVATQATTVTAGNPDLKPEIADTFTLGVGLSPTFIPGLRLNVDYYDIKVAGAIASITAQTIATGCQVNNIAEYCSRISVTNGVATINLSTFNINKLLTKGIDFEMAYGFQLGSGRIDLNVMAGYVMDLTTVDTTGTYDRAGQIGQGILVTNANNGPKWTGDVNLHYQNGGTGVNLHAHYVGPGKLDNFIAPANITSNYVESRTYFSLGASQKIPYGRGDGSFELFGAVNNLFDLGVPRGLPLSIFNTGNTASYYDTMGRSFTAGVRVKF